MGRARQSSGQRTRSGQMLVALALIAIAGAGAEELERIEFASAPLAEIVTALGRVTGNAVVADETVRGTAGFVAGPMTFRTALDELAARHRLFVTERDGVFHVSALRVEVDANGLLTIDAPRIGVAVLAERISRAVRRPILMRDAPPREISFYTSAATLDAVLEQLVTQLPDHRLERRGGGYLIEPQPRHEPRPPRAEWIGRAGERFSIASERAPLSELLNLLFAAAGREHQLLVRRSPVVDALSFAPHPFDRLLSLILERVDATFAIVDGVYYVTDAPAAAAIARTLETRPLAPRHLPVGALLDLLPPEQTAGVTIRADRASGLLTLTGAPDAVARLGALVDRLDVPPAGRRYHRFELVELRAGTLPTLLPRHLTAITLTPIPERNAVLALATDEEAAALAGFLSLADQPIESRLVSLESITVEELLAHRPVTAPPDSIRPTGDPQRFFYLGSEEAFSRFRSELRAIDRPGTQLTFHVLVLQFTGGTASAFEADLSNAPTEPESANAFLGSIGRLLALRFDVVSAFGYQFAARLDASLARSETSVVADTTLRALAGERVQFRNTTTYRYREAAGDDSSPGVVREVSSGLLLDLEGVLVGDSVVIDVSATLSRRGSDASADGDPPTTSERVLSTRVRVPLGRPMIVSGLREQEVEHTVREAPIIGRIPLIGALLSSRDRRREATELALYIVPAVEPRLEELRSDDALMEIYGDAYGEDE